MATEPNFQDAWIWLTNKGPHRVFRECWSGSSYDGSAGRFHSSKRWMDHLARFKDDEGRDVYAAYPYHLDKDAFSDFLRLHEYGWEVRIHANGAWNNMTQAVELRKMPAEKVENIARGIRFGIENLKKELDEVRKLKSAAYKKACKNETIEDWEAHWDLRDKKTSIELRIKEEKSRLKYTLSD